MEHDQGRSGIDSQVPEKFEGFLPDLTRDLDSCLCALCGYAQGLEKKEVQIPFVHGRAHPVKGDPAIEQQGIVAVLGSHPDWNGGQECGKGQPGPWVEVENGIIGALPEPPDQAKESPESMKTVYAHVPNRTLEPGQWGCVRVHQDVDLRAGIGGSEGLDHRKGKDQVAETVRPDHEDPLRRLSRSLPPARIHFSLSAGLPGCRLPVHEHFTWREVL